MARTLSSTPIAVEIDGNQYHLPDSLTAWLRIQASKEITAYEKADEDLRAKRNDLQFLPSRHQAEDGADPDAFMKELKDIETAIDKAIDKATIAATNLIVKLLQPATKGQALPDDLAQKVSEPLALEFAGKLVNRELIEPDPQ